jgi:hypothetical protein
VKASPMSSSSCASRGFSLLVLLTMALAACAKGQAYKPKNDASVDGKKDAPADAPAPDGTSSPDSGDDGGANADVADETFPTCPTNQHLCAGACVSDDDPKTCGTACSRCSDPVGGTATCVAKSCSGECPSGKKLCHGTCIDMAAACTATCAAGTHACGDLCPSNTDVTACGTMCSSCPVPPGASQASCDGTKCDFTCGPGTHRCGMACAGDSSILACGSGCVACPTSPNGTATCQSGTCALTCATSYHLCGTTCASNADVKTCGTSCDACPSITGGTPACLPNGTCSGTCPPGKKLCAGTCIDSATACAGVCPTGSHDCGGVCSQNTSIATCGASSCMACTPPTGGTSTCDGTKCDFTCNNGYHKCGTTCAADNDANACGAACTKCPTDAKGTAVCSGGACGIVCQQGYHQCPPNTGPCVANTLTSSCGQTSCSACAVPTGGTATCDGLSCGRQCPAGNQVCNGVCQANNLPCNGTCMANMHLCNNICSSDASPATCGSRCSPCADPPSHGAASCNGGSCGIACDSGYRNCPGTSLCVGNTAPACCSAADCPATAPVCTNNTCVGRALGAACTTQAECGSGKCAEGVCCSDVCNTKCMSCLSANTGQTTGTCAAVTAGVAHGSDCAVQAASTCGTTGKCDGAGACAKFAAATVCAAMSCPTGGTTQTAASTCNGSGTCVAGATTGCGFYKCNASTNICRANCTADADCASSYFCIGGSCNKKPTGYVCGSNAECSSGNCGGRCCPAGTPCDCPQPSVNNLLINPGFEMTAGITGWQTTAGTGSNGSPKWDSSDSTGCPYSGSIVTYQFGSDEASAFSQCVPVSPSKTYNFGGWIRDQTNCLNIWCELHYFSGPGCTGAQTDYFEQITWTGSTWGMSEHDPVTPPTDSASVKIACQGSPPINAPDCRSFWDRLWFSPVPNKY